MELEEIQAVWSEMSNQLEQQKKLTDKMILMMTQQKYRNKLNSIVYPEMIGAIICYIMALFILLNLSKLDNWYTMLSGVITVLIVSILPILSLGTINRMRKLDVATNNYKQTLMQYAKAKKNFQKVTRASYYLGFIVMFTILPVTSKLINGKDFFSETNSVWTLVIAIPIGIFFFIFFSRWVIKCYTDNVNSAESLIKDLEENS